MSDKRNKIIVVAVVLAIIVAITVLIAVRLNTLHCELIDKEPTYDEKVTADKMSSSDNKALAQFLGHLKYEKKDSEKDSKKVYLALNLKSIEPQAQQASPNQTTKLILYADCAIVTISFNNTSIQQVITKLEVQLLLANGAHESCEVESPKVNPVNKATNHFACSKKTYNCVSKSTSSTVAALIMNKLEFEVDGKPEVIKNKEFSTSASESC